MSARGDRARMLAVGAVMTGVLGVSAAPAFAGNAPNVIATGAGPTVGSTVALAIECTAKSNQSGATVTVIQECYSTSGLRAPGVTSPAPVAQTEIAGSAPFLAYQICATAYSLNAFGQKSDVASGCQSPDPLTGSTVLVM